MIEFLKQSVFTEGDDLFKSFKHKFEADGKWEWAPMVRIPDRNNVAKARND